MPGVSIVRDGRAHWLRRLVWVLVLAGAMGGFCYELVRDVRRLRGAGITRSWSHSSASELVFPAVTLCSMHGVKPSVVSWATRENTTVEEWVESGVELLRWQELDLEQFLDAASYSWDELVTRCTLGGRPCAEAGRVTHPFSRSLGQCHTLTAGGPVPRTHMLPQLQLRLVESDEAAVGPGHHGWMVALHPALLRYTDTAALLGMATMVPLPPHFISQLVIQRTLLTRLRTDGAPCDQHASMADVLDCHDACRLADGRGAATCRLRWLEQQPADTPPCTSYPQLLEATGHRRLLLNLSETELLHELSQCSRCLPSCSTETYAVTTMDRIPSGAPGEALGSDLTIRLTPDLEDVTERYDYTWSTLFADIGGIAGLMLGASVLTLAELIDSIVCARCG